MNNNIWQLVEELEKNCKKLRIRQYEKKNINFKNNYALFHLFLKNVRTGKVPLFLKMYDLFLKM